MHCNLSPNQCCKTLGFIVARYFSISWVSVFLYDPFVHVIGSSHWFLSVCLLHWFDPLLSQYDLTEDSTPMINQRCNAL